VKVSPLRPPAATVELELCLKQSVPAMSTVGVADALVSDFIDFGAQVEKVQILSVLTKKSGSFSYEVYLDHSNDGVTIAQYATALLTNSTVGNANGSVVDLSTGTASQSRGRHLRFTVKTQGANLGDSGLLSLWAVFYLRT
jgi:hypothetical protein